MHNNVVNLREKFSPGDPGSKPGPAENFCLKLTRQDLPEGYSEKLNFQ